MANSREPYKVIKNRFNRNRSKIKQIFCFHQWEMYIDVSPEINSVCYYTQCKKCGKFKELYYYKWRDKDGK